jgi:hypothetical protein
MIQKGLIERQALRSAIDTKVDEFLRMQWFDAANMLRMMRDQPADQDNPAP